jgi:hypothetical protein
MRPCLFLLRRFGRTGWTRRLPGNHRSQHSGKPTALARDASSQPVRTGNFLKLTHEQIEAGRSSAGGYTRARLAEWGVVWPPKSGWRQALIEGRDPNCEAPVSDSQPSSLPVVEVINAGRRDILKQVPNLSDP